MAKPDLWIASAVTGLVVAGFIVGAGQARAHKPRKTLPAAQTTTKRPPIVACLTRPGGSGGERRAFIEEVRHCEQTEGVARAYVLAKDTASHAADSPGEKARRSGAIEMLFRLSLERPDLEAIENGIGLLESLALKDPDKDIRREAVCALARIDEGADAILSRIIRRDASTEVRCEALRHLFHGPGGSMEACEALSELHESPLRVNRAGVVSSDEAAVRREALLASREYYTRAKSDDVLSLILTACDRYALYEWPGESPIVTLSRRAAADGPVELVEALRGFGKRLPQGMLRAELSEALEKK